MTTKTKKTPAAKPRRWSLGLARNGSGVLITLYTRKNGTAMKSERARLSGGKILAHDVFTGCTFQQARQRLLKASGLKNEPVATNGKEKAKKATK